MNDTVPVNNTVFAQSTSMRLRSAVFQAWIDPQQRLPWWGDDSTYRWRSMESDLRVGGK